ncbi:hypothetical protein ACA910_022311 [Epithemia clementina (nom. ined.)]
MAQDETPIISVGVPFRVEDVSIKAPTRERTELELKYDENAHNWQNKPFLATVLSSFLGSPMGMQETIETIRKDYRTSGPDELIMTTYNSPWKTIMLVSLSEAMAARCGDRGVTRLNGIYVSKIFPRSASLDVSVKEFQRWVKGMTGKRTTISKDFYVAHPCASDGKMLPDYVILFVRVQ